MGDRAPGVMREPVQKRDRIDPGDRCARGELSGRDHFERGAAMRRLEIGQRLGVTLEACDPAAARVGGRSGVVVGERDWGTRQVVIRRMARSGGARETSRGSRRLAHRSRA